MTTTNETKRTGGSRTRLIVLAVVALLALVLALAVWWFLRDDSPEEVSLEAAIESLDTETDGFDDAGEAVEDATEDAAETTSDTVELDGEWVIDTESGEFDYESATGSFVGFRIEEELNSIGSTTAVGRTGTIAGSMTIAGTSVTAASFEIDMTTITTNSSNRDDNVQDALETDTFPSASFVLTEPIELGADAATGAAVTTSAVGEMTIHGVTQPIEFTMDAQLIDDVVVAVGTTTMTFSDYGVEVPQGGPVISVDDFGVVELQFLLRK